MKPTAKMTEARRAETLGSVHEGMVRESAFARSSAGSRIMWEIRFDAAW